MKLILAAAMLLSGMVDIKQQFKELYLASVEANRELVACLGEDSISASLVSPGDSLNVSAGKSLVFCHPPEWIGTVHTHINGNKKFTPSDYSVMTLWEQINRQPGKFCVVWSEEEVTCGDRR